MANARYDVVARALAGRSPPPAARWPRWASVRNPPTWSGEPGSQLSVSAAITAGRPASHSVHGGMAARTSSASRSATAARSARSTAAMYRRTTARSSAVGAVAGAQSARRSGSRSRSVDRARCRALVTAASVRPRCSAVCRAGQPSTSRRTSTARRRGGRCWRAAMNASSIVSRVTATASGSLVAVGGGLPQAVGERLQPGDVGPGDHLDAARRRSRWSAGSRSWGSTRRARPSRASRQALVAMRYSQARSVERPSKPPMCRHARRNVSWTRSSASSTEPTMR